MTDSTQTAMRLGSAALLACSMSVIGGCSIDGAGNVHWTERSDDVGDDEPYAAYESRRVYWHGERSVGSHGGYGVGSIDTSNLTVTGRK